MTNITAAFRALRKAGYIARQNFWCCSSCGLAALPEGTEKFVFYHRQDAQNLRDDGYTYVTWDGDGHEIVRILEASGLKTEWDGRHETRIRIIAGD